MSRLIQKCVERGIEVSRGVKTYPEVCRERYRGVQGCIDLSRSV